MSGIKNNQRFNFFSYRYSTGSAILSFGIFIVCTVMSTVNILTNEYPTSWTLYITCFCATYFLLNGVFHILRNRKYAALMREIDNKRIILDVEDDVETEEKVND